MTWLLQPPFTTLLQGYDNLVTRLLHGCNKLGISIWVTLFIEFNHVFFLICLFVCLFVCLFFFVFFFFLHFSNGILTGF